MCGETSPAGSQAHPRLRIIGQLHCPFQLLIRIINYNEYPRYAPTVNWVKWGYLYQLLIIMNIRKYPM